MILSAISLPDCAVFILFLLPSLLLQVPLFTLLQCASHTIPFIVFKMPYQLIRERYFTPQSQRSAFAQHATFFQDLVIRCVRYAFAHIPASIGRVFFSKAVALPFFTFRKLRHGVLRSDVHWHEVSQDDVKGIWMIKDDSQDPDVLVYYLHGGGFSMGSAYFYLEFLLAWVGLLSSQAGYSNPAIFALDYTLVPRGTYPTQLKEARRGYEYVLEQVGEPSRVVVAGDSAGATLVLSLVLSLADEGESKKPGFATLISPWTTVISEENRDTRSDYLNAASLGVYGRQYLGKTMEEDPLASPGMCKDLGRWRRASPRDGWYITYGEEEVFAPEAERLVAMLRKAHVLVEKHVEPGWIHAWPVVKLFLCETREERTSGLRGIVEALKERMPVKE